MLFSKPNNPLKALLREIKISFKDFSLFETAFVHKSYVNEHKREKIEDNERLEFLGDAVLELVTTEFLYKEFPKEGEGRLTNFRSALVKGNHLAEVSRAMGLGKYLQLSRGEEKGGGREKNYLLANTLEALIGAIYLDRGFTAAHKFISRYILTNLGEILKKGLHIDSKSHLQEFSQDKHGVTPVYTVLSESGPDHNKIFEVAVYIGEKMLAKGTGSSKQKADQDAAVNALKEI